MESVDKEVTDTTDILQVSDENVEPFSVPSFSDTEWKQILFQLINIAQ